MSKVVVIAIGNEYRSDDGVGPAVAAELAKQAPAGVVVTRCDGEPAGLLEAWGGADLAVVVDAVLCEPSTPGRVWLSSVDNLTGVTTASGSHALGVPEALLLGRALHRVPRNLVVVAVEAAGLDMGFGLSAPVAAAVPEAVRTVLDVIGSAC
jgi:hydrogenase maturation protease